MSDQAMALFRIKFEASIRRFEMLYADGKTQEIIELIRKMIKEAQGVGIFTFDVFEQRIIDFTISRQERLNKFYLQFETESQKIFDAIRALKENKKEEKKYIIETLDALEGIAKFNGDIKEYRNHLISFCDNYCDTINKLYSYNDDELLKLAESIREEAKITGASKLNDIAVLLEDVYRGNQNEKNVFLKDYKQTVE